MKKLILSTITTATSVLAFAQDQSAGITEPKQPTLSESTIGSNVQMHYIEFLIPAVIFGLMVYLILSLLRYILDHRLKNKIIDRGITEQLATSILETNSRNKTDEAIKSAILLFGIGLGLILTYYTMPLDIHSLAIMALCIAASYLVYFYYLKNQDK